MRLLLPMAYAFLFTLKDDKYANGRPSDANDNYTYRLLELDIEPGNEDMKQQQQQHSHKVRPSYEYSHSHSHSDNTYQQNIIPRVRNVYDPPFEKDAETPKKKRNKNIKRRVRNDKKLVNVDIPDDFQDEISQFEIPKRSPRRAKKKKKTKFTTPEPDDVKVEEVEDEDENNSQEEEEEVEEKKEKVHKFTVKKKRPFVNATKLSSSSSPPRLPYKTMVDLHRGAGSSIPKRQQNPSIYRLPNTLPLITQENVQALNPNDYDGSGSGGGGTRKGIKPRDVNLILRTRHSPRILIRRYKPLFGAYMGLNLVNHKRLHRRPHKARKKPCKKCKKGRKKNKFYNKFPALASDVETIHSNPSICNQHHHQHHQQHQQHQQALFPSQISHLGMSTFPFYANQPSSSVSYQYSPNSPEYYEENIISPRLPSQPVNSYVQMPFESHHYPSETYTTLPFVSTELPSFSAKTEYAPTEEEMPNGGYDVHEHENTEELAAHHQQETDVNLDGENDALQYDDNEDENAAEEYVENEEDEPNTRWDEGVNLSKKTNTYQEDRR